MAALIGLEQFPVIGGHEGAGAVHHILQHTRGRNLLKSPAIQEQHFMQCTALSRRVPAFVLDRKKGLEHLADQRRLIEELPGPKVDGMRRDGSNSPRQPQHLAPVA